MLAIQIKPNNRSRRYNIIYYYSFKIFPRFCLVKTTRIIHQNQLLFTKFGKNLRHIEWMTSKLQPAENCWTDDVKMTSKVQPAADYWTVDRENLRTRLCYIWRISLNFWIRLSYDMKNSADLGGCYPPRPSALWITPSLICRILHIIRKPNSIIPKHRIKASIIFTEYFDLWLVIKHIL